MFRRNPPLPHNHAQFMRTTGRARCVRPQLNIVLQPAIAARRAFRSVFLASSEEGQGAEDGYGGYHLTRENV